MTTLAASFKAVHARMEAAARRSGHNPEDIRLVAVSKSVDTDKVKQAQAECAHQLFGENRADELVRKVETCGSANGGAEFHYIGPLQTNKVRKVVGAASLIHSVDSERLLRAIDARAKLQDIVQPILIQVNISGEEVKQGIEPGQLDALLHLTNSELSHVQVNGLMTMAPFAPAGDIRWIFEDLRKLRDKSVQDGPSVSLKELSMGMTGDFEAAIEEGATLVRVGTALFAP
ncbi:MAG: YggS family pyridoxal phosphate-dependent enzyme [Coriobacteriia bacterium]|nr:YggS family pyridoxal phosphate-dependent enzyme [Coriobacteriia bacterium]